MLTSEAEILMSYMHELWPKWEYTPAVAKLWVEWLTEGPVAYEDARRATKKYRLSSRYNSPQPDGLRDALRSGSGGESQKADGGYGGFYIECVANSHHPGRVGRRIPVLFGESRKVPTEHRLRELAERFRAKHEAIYGGEWRLMDAPEYAQYFTGMEQKGQNNV